MPRVVVLFQVPLRQDGDKLERLRERASSHRKEGLSRATRLGPRHHPASWKRLHRELIERFGGWTLRDAAALGEWKDPDTGAPVQERSCIYEVDVPEERLDEMRALLRQACVTFVQKCIRMVVRGESWLVEERRDDEPL